MFYRASQVVAAIFGLILFVRQILCTILHFFLLITSRDLVSKTFDIWRVLRIAFLGNWVASTSVLGIPLLSAYPGKQSNLELRSLVCGC